MEAAKSKLRFFSATRCIIIPVFKIYRRAPKISITRSYLGVEAKEGTDMQSGKWVFRCVIFLGILVGPLVWRLYRGDPEVILGYYSRLHYDERADQYDAVMRERFPGEPSLLIHRDAEFYLNLFKSRPGRPWLLWRWWDRHPARQTLRVPEPPSLRPTPEARRRIAEFSDLVRTLRELDPDNGYPLVFQAWIEAEAGIVPVHEDGASQPNYAVVDVERAGKAADLLRQAVRRERFTFYGREAAEEWMGVAGVPATYAEALLALERLTTLPLPPFPMERDAALRLVAEARRRAESERTAPDEGAAGTAYGILRDLQTLGARIAVGEPGLVAAMAGHSVVSAATEEGAAILREAGQSGAAVRLLERGRSLLRPGLLAGLMNRTDLDSLENGSERPGVSELAADPELIGEAKRLLTERRKHAGRDEGVRFGEGGDIDRAGLLAGVSFPAVEYIVPWTRPLFTRDELKTSAHFELWGLQKTLTVLSLFLAWAVFIVLLSLYGARVLAREGAAAEEWPPFRRIASAGVLYGLLAAGPGLAATFAGNVFWLTNAKHWGWHISLSVLGLAAAYWALASRARRGGEGSPVRSRRLFLGGLAVGMVVWAASYSVLDRWERKWAERDRLFVPRPPRAVMPIESRVVDALVRNIREETASEY